MKLWVCLLFVGADAFRARHKAAKPEETEPSYGPRRRRTRCPVPQRLYEPFASNIPGKVDWLYTFGTPGTGSPSLQHQSNANGIFPGTRAWTRSWRTQTVDIVASITAAIWLWHPLMEAESMDKNADSVVYDNISDAWWRPAQKITSVILHMPWEYWDEVKQRNCDNGWYNYSMFSLNISYVPQPGFAARLTAMYGWGLAGTAYYDGTGSWQGGPQASHLLQHPDTLACVLTFQGTQHLEDWYSNLAMRPAHFCGLVYEDEECPVTGLNTCKVRRPRGSFVHWGFADTLRRMVKVPAWQQEIRANLHKCSSVTVTGHSLGGATAELFSACISQELRPGDYGYEEDYKWMSWRGRQPQSIGTYSSDPNQDPCDSSSPPEGCKGTQTIWTIAG